MTALGFRPNLDGYWDVSTELVRHVNTRTTSAITRWREQVDRIETPEAAQAYQERVRTAVLDGFGGLPQTSGPPPVEWLGTIDANELGGADVSARHRIERLVFHSSPGVPVPASLYRPDGVDTDTPGPAVLFVCGHAEPAKAYPPYQAVCARLATAGITVLTFDPFGQGERVGYLDRDSPWTPPAVAWGTTEHTHAGMASWWLGQSVARWFVHDARRAIDLLADLPEVDPARIGITGNSGGGTLCTWMMAAEPRLAAAAPGTFVTSRGHYLWSGQRQDAEQILPAGTARGVDHDDLVAAMAPRPVAVLAVEYDFFPYEGTVETVARARRIYDLLGAGDALRLVSAPSTHEYAPALAAAATDFFAEAFGLPEPRAAADPAFEPGAVPARRLWCTPSGQVAVDRPGSKFVHDLNVDEFHRLRAGQPRAGRDVRRWLRDRVRAHRQLPARPQTRWLPGPAGTRHAFWRSEPDLWGAGVLLGAGVSPGRAEAERPVWLALLPDGTADLVTSHRLFEVTGAADDAAVVLVPDLRGQGALRQHERDGLDPADLSSTVFKLDCDLMWLDDSLAAGRVFDVLRGIDVLLADPALRAEHPWLDSDTPVHVYGEGLGAFHALLAGVLDERIATVQVHDPWVDPDRLVRQRLWDDGRGSWQALIPGLAVHAPLVEVERLLGDRLVRG